MKNNRSLFLFALALLPSLGLAIGQTTRVSVNSAGGQANNNSFWWGSHGGSFSADGRYVAFVSWADNLVVGDTNGAKDFFVHDKLTGHTERINVNSAGEQSNPSDNTVIGKGAVISADGRYVAFYTDADNMVSNDTNSLHDVFVHDRQTGQTERVSINSLGEQANDRSYFPSITADGRFVAFMSYASNLVPGDTNGSWDIFVHDRLSGKTERASIDSVGGESNRDSGAGNISADGRYVVFSSDADNLVVGDTNLANDIFVHDRKTGQTTRVSVNSVGGQADGRSDWPLTTADGRYVTFASKADNLVDGDTNGYIDAFVHDRQTGQTSRISVDSAGIQGNGDSSSASLSADGRYVTFSSYANNLVAEDTNGVTDAFVHDRQTGKTTRVNVSTSGKQADNRSWGEDISADGRYVTFDSDATNLVVGDTNGHGDVFSRDRWLQSQTEADLSLGLKGPTNAVKGSDVIYKFTVINSGSINVPNTTLTGVISNRGRLKSISAGQGTCSLAAVSVCRLGTLTPGQRVTVTAIATINGATTVNATAQAGPKDSKPGNNAKSITTLLQ